MSEELVVIHPWQFLRYAGSSLDRWKTLAGVKIEHSLFGRGIIQEVNQKDGNISLLIQFDQEHYGVKTRKFAPEVLEKCGFLMLPPGLAASVTKYQPILPTPRKSASQLPTALPISKQPLPRPARHMLPPHSPQPSQPVTPLFRVSQEVSVRGEPNRRGLIQKPPFFSEGQWQYEVFFSVVDRRVYRESDLEEYQASFAWGGLAELLRNLALVKLQRPLSEHLYALYGSRTQFEVYQFKPVLKFLANPDQRLLIADEVGLGKTIEAGIIYLELQARLQLDRVLVVCPSGLRYKWQDEMKQRFDEEFNILDITSLRQFIQQYDERSRLRGIVSLELLRRRELTEAFDENRISFDLVIIDEAHHCRNTATRSNEIATVLSDNADAMLLLTATPLQIGNEDLFNLLRILDPGEFDDLEVFLDRLEPNRYVNMAAQVLATGQHQAALKELRKVENTTEHSRFHNNPHYSELAKLLSKDYLRREELVAAQRKLVELNTLAQVFTRTRKREIAEKVPTRAAFVLNVAFTPVEARFYERVVEHARQEFMRLHGTNYAVGWVSIMRERQTASCVTAARQRFSELAKEARQDVLEEGFYDPNILGETNPESEEEQLAPDRSARSFRLLLPAVAELERDSKFEIFWATLSKVLAEDTDSKIIVFSFFIATIEHLYRQLKQLGVGVLRLHGGFKVPDRQRIIDDFREKPEFRVLISSDVGAEGLDFQFSNTIFNYDLPWNPMRLEQRIGRIDRFGQESNRIRIYNLVIQDSIESRILMRLYERIGLFQQAIGDIEAILGEEIRELTKRVYARKLTPKEEMALADQAAANIIRRRQELEEFEKNRLQFMGQEAIFSTLVNQTIESGNYVSEVEIRSLVETFIQKVFSLSRLECNLPPDGTYCLWINEDLAEHLRGYILTKKKNDRSANEFLKALIPGRQLPVTFDSQMASRRKLLHFITLRHPLAQAALDYWREKVDPAATFARFGLRAGNIPDVALRSGEYYFFLFTFHATGMEKTSRLVPVVVVPQEGDVYVELSRRLLHLVQTSSFEPAGSYPRIDPADLEYAQDIALRHMASQRDSLEAEIQRNNDALVSARLLALSQSYEAKRRRIQETLGKVREMRIRRLYEGQLRNQKARYDARRKEIEALREVSVSFSLALRGIVSVEEKDAPTG